MRSLKLFVLSGILALSMVACGGDDDDGGGADSAATIDGAVGGADGGAGAAPEITAVAWTHADPCTQNSPSDVDVAITVTDTDSAAGTLTVAGNVSSCGAIDALEDTITCPQAAPYAGTVTVSDPEGNEDTVTFTIAVCVDGTVP